MMVIMEKSSFQAICVRLKQLSLRWRNRERIQQEPCRMKFAGMLFGFRDQTGVGMVYVWH